MKKIVTLLLSLSLCACAGDGLLPGASADATPVPDISTTTAGNANLGALDAEYKIGVDDVVKVDVWKNPDLSVEVPVRPDGMISVPLIGDVEVGGKVPAEVAEIIKKKLSVYVRKPRVTVIMSQLNSHEYLSRVRVTGAVNEPMTLPYRQGLTVMDAVLEAGGLSKFASANKTMLYRKQNGESRVFPIKLNDILKKGDLRSNFDLAPGDVITIPERAF